MKIMSIAGAAQNFAKRIWQEEKNHPLSFYNKKEINLNSPLPSKGGLREKTVHPVNLAKTHRHIR